MLTDYNSNGHFDYESKCQKFFRDYQGHQYLRYRMTDLYKLAKTIDPTHLTRILFEFYEKHPASGVPSLRSIGMTPFDVFKVYDKFVYDVLKLRSKELKSDCVEMDLSNENTIIRWLFRAPYILGILTAIAHIIYIIMRGIPGKGAVIAGIVAFVVLLVLCILVYIILYAIMVLIQELIMRIIISNKIKKLSASPIGKIENMQIEYLESILQSPAVDLSMKIEVKRELKMMKERNVVAIEHIKSAKEDGIMCIDLNECYKRYLDSLE